MLTKSGAKLMDFGLARATGLAGPGGTSGVTIAALTQTPTVAQPLTAEGTIVGTFQYMSPEQLEGKEADARSDVWALGCVLYEMATGRRAFDGKSQASLISSIMATEPAPLTQVMPMVPPALDRLIKACLNKDADQRLQTAHDARLQLQWIAEGGSQAGVPAPVAARRKSREALAWTLAGLGAVAALALGLARTRQKPPAARVTRFSVEEPEATLAVSWPRVSPDGKMLAFLANDSTGVRRVWVRPLDAIEAHPLSGADGNARPFWSPDSRFLAFILDGRLRKVPVGGGPAVTIAEVPGGFDGSWGKGDVILFDGGQSDSIRMVSASGGLPKPATTFDRSVGENQHAWPFFLPDGKHFLFTARGAGGSSASIRLGTLGSMTSRVIGQTDGRVEFAPPGYIVFPSGGTLLAQPFDAAGGRTTGDPVPVGEDIAMGNESGDFSISMGGVMAYRSEKVAQGSSLIWVGRDGRRLGRSGAAGRVRRRRAVARRRPDRRRHQHRPAAAPGHLGPRPAPGDDLAPDLRSGRRHLAGLVARRKPDRLRHESRRRFPGDGQGGQRRRRRGHPDPRAGGPGTDRLVARRSDRRELHRSASRPGTSTCSRRSTTGGRRSFSRRLSPNGADRSRRTAGGWPTPPASRGSTKSMSSHFPGREESGRSPPPAGAFPAGGATAARSSTGLPTR